MQWQHLVWKYCPGSTYSCVQQYLFHLGVVLNTYHIVVFYHVLLLGELASAFTFHVNQTITKVHKLSLLDSVRNHDKFLQGRIIPP